MFLIHTAFLVNTHGENADERRNIRELSTLSQLSDRLGYQKNFSREIL